MRVLDTAIAGAHLIELDEHRDPRGSFSRSFCEADFARAGLAMRVVQVNHARTADRLTLRGLHYQADPHGEPKVVHCVRGRVFDVAVDLRPQSPTFRRWTGIELGPDTGRMLYIPPGCAHGYLTLEPDSDLIYLMGAAYQPGSARGLRWNDPAVAIPWPHHPRLMSDRDASFPDWQPEPPSP